MKIMSMATFTQDEETFTDSRIFTDIVNNSLAEQLAKEFKKHILSELAKGNIEVHRQDVYTTRRVHYTIGANVEV